MKKIKAEYESKEERNKRFEEVKKVALAVQKDPELKRDIQKIVQLC